MAQFFEVHRIAADRTRHGIGMRYRTFAEAEEKARDYASYIPAGSAGYEALPIEAPVPDWQCPGCQSLNVQGTAWVDLFTGIMTNDEPPTDTIYCSDCEDNVDRLDEYETEPAPFPEALNG